MCVCVCVCVCVFECDTTEYRKGKKEEGKEKKNVITISETWLSADIKNNEISINGYHPPVRKDRSDDPHGGVAIYVKNSLICREA